VEAWWVTGLGNGLGNGMGNGPGFGVARGGRPAEWWPGIVVMRSTTELLWYNGILGGQWRPIRNNPLTAGSLRGSNTLPGDWRHCVKRERRG
jgi:hypothetical protein